MTTPKKQDHSQLFFHDGYLLGLQAAKYHDEPEKWNAVMHTFYQTIDELLDALLDYARQSKVSVDCCKGCSQCCYQPVFANDYEISYLRHSILTNFPPDVIGRIRQKAMDKNKTVRELTPAQVLIHKQACPLLKDNVCSIYEARPVACRIYLSMDVTSCTNFFHHPQDPDHYPRLLDFPLKAGRMINQGFSAALKESGIESYEMRLEELFEKTANR